MQKIYSRIDWKNFPSEETAVNETNLNRMDSGLDAIDDRVVAMDATKFDAITANSLIKDWEIDEKTGIITITKLSGEKILFDLNIEKIPVSFALSDGGILTMTTDDGTKFTANIGAMIPILTFDDSDEIAVSVSGEGVNKTYSFSIKNGSITEDKLRPDYLADIKVESAKAEKAAEASGNSSDNSASSADMAKNYATKAKTYADTIRGIAEVGIATTEKVGLVRPDGDSIVVDADGTIHSFTQLTNSNAIGEKGTYALDATEKNPLVKGSLASDIKSMQEANKIFDDVVVCEEVEGDDDKLLDSLMEQLLVQNIAITSDSNQTLKFMYGDNLIGSIALQGLVLNTVPCTKLSLDKKEEKLSAFSLNNLILVPSVEPVDCTEPVKWYSSNERIAIVSNGVVERITKKTADCIIYAKCGNHTVQCNVRYILPSFSFRIGIRTDEAGVLVDDSQKMRITSNEALELPKGTKIAFSNAAKYNWRLTYYDLSGNYLKDLTAENNKWHTESSVILEDDYMIAITMKEQNYKVFTEDTILTAQNTITLIAP